MPKSKKFEQFYLARFMDKELERKYYNEVLERINRNPRYYLDNLEKLDVFTVSFENYHGKKGKVYK